jgi:hypothetical protein
MGKPKIALYDLEFAHLKNYTGFEPNTMFEWDRSGTSQKIGMYTERCFDMVHQSKNEIDICWLLEPKAIHPNGFDYIVNACGHMHFDYVMCFDDSVRDALPKGKTLFWTPGGSYMYRKDWGIWDKSKNVSIIASSKTWAPGHRFRQEVIAQYGNQFDFICGHGRNFVPDKIDALRDYRYSVAIENSSVNRYFTDKITDCFLAGTVPIFWGCPKIGEIFDPAGIIQFETLDELKIALANCNESDYLSRMPAIQHNFELAKQYAIVEDYLWNASLKRFYE